MQSIEIFVVNKKTKVLFFTRYAEMGASSRYRFFQYIPYLNQNGFDCTVSSLFDNDYLMHRYQVGSPSKWHIIKAYLHRLIQLININKFDLIVIEKELFPYFPAWPEKLISLLNIPFIVDYDDALFHQYDQHQNTIIRMLLGKKISNVMRYSQLVVAGNSYLSDYAKNSESQNVKIIPTVIDLARYPVKRASYSSQRVKIGWIGSPSTVNYLVDIEDVLIDVCAKTNAELVIIGVEKSPFKSFVPTLLPWSKDSEVDNMKLFDIGIMPLPDSPWERGKCGFKLIQYMGCHVPVIASSVGVNNDIVDDGINGFLVSNNQEWKESLFKLIDDESLRRSMSAAGRKKVELEYSLQVTENKILDLYMGVQQREFK